MITLKSLGDTQKLGEIIAAALGRGDCVLLAGDLGAGKTELARAIIRARAGEAIDVPSPTFALVEAYQFDTPLYHIDLYRLASSDHALELGLEDMIAEGITLIEWPDRAEAYLPADRLEIAIGQKDGDARELSLTPMGHDWRRRVEDILAQWRRV